MATTTSKSFDEFSAKIYPTNSQRFSLSTRRGTTHNHLLNGFGATSDMPLIKTVIIGSAARGTIIRPINDIDVMAVFSDEDKVYESSYINDSFAFINRIRAALDCRTEATTGTRGQAIRMFYKDDMNVDIAPVFGAGDGGYLLPNGTGGWIKTDPDVQATWFTHENARLSGNLAPLLRILKRWNNVHSKHFNSYHLEVVTANSFSSLGRNYRDALHKFFLWAPNHLDAYDPASYSGYLSSYLTQTTRQNLLNRLSTAASRAQLALEAEARGDHAEAIRLWRIELGDEFPLYG